jgi:hypothetical protein
MSSNASASNRFYLAYSGAAPSGSQLNALGNAIAVGPYTADIQSLHAAPVVLEHIEIVDLASSSGAVGIYSPTTGGLRAGTEVPENTCVSSLYQVARKYRGGKPKNFWPFGVTSDIVNARDWSPTAQTSFQTGLQNFFAALNGMSTGPGSVTNHVNVSYYSGFTNVAYGTPTKYRRTPTPRATPVVDTVTAIVVQPTLGSQRRRLTSS